MNRFIYQTANIVPYLNWLVDSVFRFIVNEYAFSGLSCNGMQTRATPGVKTREKYGTLKTLKSFWKKPRGKAITASFFCSGLDGDETSRIIGSTMVRHRNLIKQEKIFLGSDYKDHDLVLCTVLGTPVIPRHINKVWDHFLKKIDVYKIKFHDRRHTQIQNH